MALSTTQYGYIIDPMVPFTDGKGKTIKDGFVRVFVAGSSTPVITYRNFDGAANQDQIELDNSGRTKTSVIGSKGLTYKVCVYDAFHSQESPILTVDKVSVIGANITAGAGATVVTGLDGLTTKPDGFVDASVVGSDGYVALDHTLVDDNLDTDAKVTAVENDRYVPLLNDDVNDPDSKITLGRLWQWVLGKIKSLPTAITAFRTGDVIPVDGPSGLAKMSKDALLQETTENALAGNVFEIVNLNDSSNWVAGGVNATTGWPTPDSSRLTTKSIPFAKSGTIVYERVGGGAYTNTFYAYDAEGNYLGYVSGSDRITQVRTTYPSVYFFKFSLIGIAGVSAEPENIGDIANFTKNHFVYKYADLHQLDITYEKALDADAQNLKKIFNVINLNDTSFWSLGSVNATTGEPTADSSRLRSNMLAFNDEVYLNAMRGSGVSFGVNLYCYDVDGNYLGFKQNTENIPAAKTTYPSAYYYRILLLNISGQSVSITNFANIVTFPSETLTEKYAEFSFVNNKINALGVDDHTSVIDLSDSSLWRIGGLNSTTGLPTTDANRLSTKQIPFATDTTFSYSWKTGVSGQLVIYAYDKDYGYLGFRNNTNSIASVVQSFPTAYYFIVSLIGLSGAIVSPQNLSNIVSFSGTYYQYVLGLRSDVGLMLEDGRDVLAGKKWYACGDSFTAGNPNYIFLHGRYAGKNAVYPYFIGNRTSMDVHNIAVSGSTIAYKENYSTYDNCFSAGLYQTIPEDADYITLKFGINDGHQNIPVGTIDDETNDTVCGAWNVVLSYLINKCPYAKIGVIVSNGCDTTAYSKAARDCAEKWGVSYIDENFDYKVPLLHRVNGKPLVSATAHQIRLEAFRVSENDTHPNTKAHEFESTFIESWLRTL